MRLMIIKKRNLATWLFFFTIIALENFSWLIPYDDYMISSLKFSDIGVLLALIWTAYVYVKYKPKKNKYKPMIWPGLFFAVILISSMVCNSKFGQSLGLSIRQVRYLIVCFLLYYAIFRALKFGVLKKEDIVKIIKFQGIAESVIFILQWVLIDKFVFLYTGATFEYANARLRVSYMMPFFLMYLSLNDYMNGKDKTKNLFLAFLGAFILVAVCQHRAPTLIMLVTFIIGFLLWKKGASKKILIAALAGTILIAFISNSTLIQSALNVLFNGASEGNTLTIRNAGRLYYFQQLTNYNAWITGLGQANINCSRAYSAAGNLLHYYLVDNGIFGYLYCYGVIGIVWILAFYISILKKSYYLFKHDRKYHFLLYIIFEIGNLYMGIHWFWYYTAPFVLFICLLDWEYQESKENKENKEMIGVTENESLCDSNYIQ